MNESQGGELLGRIEVIEAQPLGERAPRFAQLHDELLEALQRSDRGESAAVDGP